MEHPLKIWRVSNGLTQAALGKEFGVAGQTIWRWENGGRKIDAELLPKVCERTGIPARDLRPDLAKLVAAE